MNIYLSRLDNKIYLFNHVYRCYVSMFNNQAIHFDYASFGRKEMLILISQKRALVLEPQLHKLFVAP